MLPVVSSEFFVYLILAILVDFISRIVPSSLFDDFFFFGCQSFWISLITNPTLA